ncbi:MAG TPA: HAD family acid phosphatase [Vicinamibacterales bacterium]|nr:HAD family acid phosphatase [Vicinamibacterales bacterium]
MSTILRSIVVVTFLAASVACRSASAPPAAPPPTAAVATTTPKADPDSIRWVRESAEYVAVVLQTYALATSRVEQAATGRAAGTWAVVLDADETVIANVTYQAERARAGLGYSPESWNAWVRRRESTALPGAAAFLARVRALGGRIAIVTNRLQSECADTEAVFARERLVFDVMLCRPDGSPSDKNPRFDAVANGSTPIGGPPLAVVAFVGDNILDFPMLSQAAKAQGEAAFAAFGTRYFLIPNPMYGSWQ